MKNSTHRVASYLLSQYHHVADPQPVFELPIARRLIAGFLAMQPETLSRMISNFKSQALIEVNGKIIKIVDREGLMAFQ